MLTDVETQEGIPPKKCTKNIQRKKFDISLSSIRLWIHPPIRSILLPFLHSLTTCFYQKGVILFFSISFQFACREKNPPSVSVWFCLFLSAQLSLPDIALMVSHVLVLYCFMELSQSLILIIACASAFEWEMIKSMSIRYWYRRVTPHHVDT